MENIQIKSAKIGKFSKNLTLPTIPQKAVMKLHSKNPSTKFITNEIFRKYKNELATQTLNTNTNSELAKNLAFTNVYGILLDQGLKKKKER